MVKQVEVGVDSPRRAEAEAFIRSAFLRHHGAQVRAFAPHLVLLEQERGVVAAAGWRSAGEETLFLERYLDAPIEDMLCRLTGQHLARERLVEVGHLASERSGGTVQVILSLARHLAQSGFEWVVFTATEQVVAIFSRLGLPLLALAQADPARLGEAAQDWGSYYDNRPIVVAGRIRIAIDRIGAGE